MRLLDILNDFFYVMDWKLVIAGLIMIVIFLLIVYLIVLTVLSFQKRKAEVGVSLPDINKYADSENNSTQFKGLTKMEVELIENDEVDHSDVPTINEDSFFAALSLETGKYIPKPNLDLDMPEVEVIDYETIRREKEQEELERIRKIAKADEQDIIEESLIDNEE